MAGFEVIMYGRFWVIPEAALQLDRKLASILTSKRSKNISIRIPTANELPVTIDSLLTTVAQVEQVLASKIVVSTPVTDFIASMEGQIDQDTLQEAFKNKGDALKLMRAQELLVTGHLDEAREKIHSVIADKEASIESKFWAYLWLERVELLALKDADSMQEARTRLLLNSSMQLRTLARKGPSHLKFYALIASKAAELEAVVFHDWGLYLNWRAHETESNDLWKVELVFARAQSSRHVVQKYNQCLRLAHYASISKVRWALSEPLTRIVRAISGFLLRLKGENNIEMLIHCSSSALQVCRLAAWIAEQNRDDDCLYYSIVASLTISRDTSNEAWVWATDQISKIKSDRVKAGAEKALSDHRKRISGEYIDGDIKTSSRQVYENMAAALGIDLSDPNDPAAQTVLLGIKDADPGRVLKNCKYLFVSLGFSRPLIAELLRLPSAGDKVLHCTLHNYAVGAQSLDGIYAAFKNRFCNSCNDCSPRESGWEFSDEWQKQENIRHSEFMNSFWNALRSR